MRQACEDRGHLGWHHITGGKVSRHQQYSFLFAALWNFHRLNNLNKESNYNLYPLTLQPTNYSLVLVC